jgi:hypothetical protein
MQVFGCPEVRDSSLFPSAIYCQVTAHSAGILALWYPTCCYLENTGRPACPLDSPERP